MDSDMPGCFQRNADRNEIGIGADMERFAVTVLRGITAHGRTV